MGFDIRGLILAVAYLRNEDSGDILCCGKTTLPNTLSHQGGLAADCRVGLGPMARYGLCTPVLCLPFRAGQ